MRLDKVKRQARKEAWYDKPGEKPTLNPFKRSRTIQWTGGSREHLNEDLDLEAGNGFRSAPPTHTPTQRTEDTEERSADASRALDKEMPRGVEDANARTSDPSSHTIAQTLSATSNTARPVSAEHKARRRFLSKFRKNGGNSEKQETDDTMRTDTSRSEKKSLGPPKYTVGNQLRGTLFNSWINVLILCAPLGIILNYTNVQPVSCDTLGTVRQHI